MDKNKYQKGFNITTRMLKGINPYYETEEIIENTLRVLRELDSIADDLDTFLGARDAFAQPEFRRFTYYMCLGCPVHALTKLRGLGFAHTIYTLMVDSNLYPKEIMKELTYKDVFSCDDIGMIARSIVGFIMDIPDGLFPIPEKFLDLTNKVWDKCLEIAMTLQQKYSILCNVKLEDLIPIVIECTHGDAIGNDDTGMETFYNKFVDMCIINIREIGGSEIHSYLINKLTEVGIMILEELDWTWGLSPQRLMLYVRLKVLLYRTNPTIVEQWSHVDRNIIYEDGKEKW